MPKCYRQYATRYVSFCQSCSYMQYAIKYVSFCQSCSLSLWSFSADACTHTNNLWSTCLACLHSIRLLPPTLQYLRMSFLQESICIITSTSGETNPRIGIRRFESFCEFCGRARRFESQSQGFESLLPGKKHPKLLKIVQNWATFCMSLR
jgi:hypothetical protein